MRTRIWITLVLSIFAAVAVLFAQQRAGVQMEKPGPIRPGGPIAFTVKLDQPLPKGARFELRISPLAVDEQIPFGSVMQVNGSDTVFRVAGTLPENALPGEWHISVVWLFLPGASWTGRSLTTNDLRFHVEGQPYPIPAKAEVTLDKEGGK